MCRVSLDQRVHRLLEDIKPQNSREFRVAKDLKDPLIPWAGTVHLQLLRGWTLLPNDGC